MSRCCLKVGLFLGLLAPSFYPLAAADISPVGAGGTPTLQNAGGTPTLQNVEYPSDVPLVAPAVRQAMQDRNFAEARKAIDEAAKTKGAPSDYLAYLRAWSLYLEKQHEQAIAALEKFEKDFPQSSWLRRVRFAKAQAMVAKGDFRGAQAIYEQEAKYLLSSARRQQSAAVYLEFADARFQPSRENQQPDYKSAREFYALVLDMGLAAQQRAKVEFRIGYCLQKLGNHAEAANAFGKFLAAYTDDPRQMEVRYRLGECLLAAGKLPEARKAWRELLKMGAGSGEQGAGRKVSLTKENAVHDWAAEAAYHLAETWHCPNPGNDEDFRRGVAALEDFINRFPTHELAPAAHLQIAQSQIHRVHQDEAVATLQNFLKDPRRKDCKELPQARWSLGQVYHGQKKYAEALAVWREYLIRHTAHEGWSAVQQSIIDTEYLVAQEKFKAGDDAAATKLLTEFMDRYPLEIRNPSILYIFGQIHQRQKQWEAAIADWERLVTKYPHCEEASHAQFMIGRTQEEQLNRYDEAREHYRLVTGRDAAEAGAALAAIPAKSMEVKTERVFRSSETPQLKLATRNVPSVKVRIYKIDLETYFRKMHSIAGIQRLNVSLIDPDTTLEFTVPEYVKCKPLTSSIPVPLPDGLKAGVAAVTVSSPTLETTTLLIQSNLEILVKSSRDEVLIFAENALTGKPWPGVRLLISDGRSVFVEAKTGEDGFFRQRCPELKDTACLLPNQRCLLQWGTDRNPELRGTSCLRVFAVAEGGHVASTAVRLGGESVAQELADRIYVDTDRQSYFAGETVHVRGCARHAEGDRFVIEPGKKLIVEVLGEADRRLRRRDVTLSAMGTFSFDFLLPAEMPEGAYKVLVHDQAGHRQSIVFQICQPEEETLQLLLDLPNTVYYRGEILEGTLRAVLPQDRPLAGVKVSYKLGTATTTTATTDACGEVHVTIPTAELESYGPMTFEATIPSRSVRSVSVRRDVTIATRGFSIGMETNRLLFVEGESIDLRVKTTDAAGQPISERVNLKVVRQAFQPDLVRFPVRQESLTYLQDRVGETAREELVEDHDLATTADGMARQTLKLTKSGSYFLRATGTDRFGNTIANELKLTVSGNDDPQRLLLLVDRTQLKTGDTAEARIVWRGKPALAVVTCHFDRLIEQRQIAIVTGVNRLHIPVTAAMAPGFTLAVSVMADHPAENGEKDKIVMAEPRRVPPEPASDNRLHEAACSLRVDADLQVKVECHRHGDAVNRKKQTDSDVVTVTTCDAQGKPVAAEVSLAMLSAGRGDDGAPTCGSLATFFRSRGRATQFQTASSIQFHYQPANRAIGTAELEEDLPLIVPRHISSQQGIRAAHARAAARSVDSSAEDDLFGGAPNGPAAVATPGTAAAPFVEEAVGPSPNAGPPLRRQQNRRNEAESTVVKVPRPAWSYWNPSITTGPDGRATISLDLPNDATNLTVVAKAITHETLAGQVSQELVLKKELLTTIHLPPAFTDGDEVELPVVVQNQLLDKGSLEVAINVNVDGIEWNDKKTLEVKSRGRLETSFKTTIRQLQRPSQEGGYLPSRSRALFTVTTKAGTQSDVCRRSVPILPYGVPCRVMSTGVANGAATVTIAPSRRHWVAPTLQIAVSPTIQRSLLDLFEPATDFGGTHLSSAHPNTTADPADIIVGTEGLPAASDLMAALALAKLNPVDTTEGRMLDERIRTTLSLLIATQHEGNWSINGHESSIATNALAYWSLVLAGKAGYDVPLKVLDSSLARLQGSADGDKESDLETKTIVLHASAIGGQGDFTLANHLLRDRKLLSPLGRAYLALALLQMDRKETAADVLKQPEPVGQAFQPDQQPKDIEAQALTALALLGLDPASPQAKVLIESILGQRSGLRWTPEKATGPAILAVTTWLAKGVGQAFQPDGHAGPCHLAITVNGKAVKTLDLDPQGPTQTVDVPLALLVKGQQRIELRPSGPARLVYRCTLGGIDPAEFVQGTSAAWSIQRSYEPGTMEVDEKEIPRGFVALAGNSSRAQFGNRMTQLSATRRGNVEIQIDSNQRSREGNDELLSSSGRGAGSEGLLVIEPIPSGARIVTSSLEGCFDRAEILPGRVVFFLDHVPSGGSIRYELEGVFPSSNLISPTLLRRVGRDVPLAVAKPKSLVVLPQGTCSTDPYRLSPDELLDLGAIAKRKGDVDAATRYYTELLDSWHGQSGFGLSNAAYKQTIFALMELGMGRAAPAKLVQYCEVIKEKWPAEPVTLDQLLTAAGAYREIGELERSYMASRATIEGSFTRESGVAGFLDTQGEFLRSISLMNRLARDYPPEPYLAEAELELAQRVYVKAAEAPTLPSPGVGVEGDGNAGRMPTPQDAGGTPTLPTLQTHPTKLDREALVGRAWQKLDAFLTGYPTDTAADQAAFAAANAQLELKRYADAAQAVTDYARRYPQSELLDSYWYILAYCDFATGKHASAIDVCRKVAETQHLDKQSGRMVDSPNKYRAIYILGQIYQSLGQRGDAIREYRRVEGRIPDAKSSVSYFLRKHISLPDCTTLKPGTAAEVELSFRNIAVCDVKVYRVDLMKFCEAAQALGDLSQVNLAGIRPLHNASIMLRDGKDYSDHSQKLALPLKKEGAYLVVCRGEDLYAGGLLLISPLEIESRFDPPTGQVRVFVKDATTDKYISDVQIKLMPRVTTGLANVMGATDLRGVFVGNCPAAAATIVAQAGSGRYAYFASQPPANDAREVIAGTAAQQDDPTVPFQDGQPRGRQAVAVNQPPAAPPPGRNREARARSTPAPMVPLPEHLLPPLGPNSPTLLSRGSDEAAERKIRAVLKEPTQIEFVETPLKDVIEYLKELHHIEIQLDAPALKESGVEPDGQVTKNLKGISLRSALKLILDELQLKYVIHNGVLLITSPTKAESDEYMETRAYPVEDIVRPERDGDVDIEPLKEMLTNTVATKTWSDNGGTGTISEMIVGKRVLLVLSQTQEVHEEIECALEMLRKAGGLKTGQQDVAGEDRPAGEPIPPTRTAPRMRRPAPSAAGGMGGGMGGMGMGGRSIPRQQQTTSGGDADLLEGLKSSNAANQKAKVLRLKQRQDAGQDAGKGGGMGGGFF